MSQYLVAKKDCGCGCKGHGCGMGDSGDGLSGVDLTGAKLIVAVGAALGLYMIWKKRKGGR